MARPEIPGSKRWELPGGMPGGPSPKKQRYERDRKVEFELGGIPSPGLFGGFADFTFRQMRDFMEPTPTPAGPPMIDVVAGRRDEADDNVTWVFDSPDAFARQAAHRWESRFENPSMADSRKPSEGDWGGTKTFEDAVRLARDGWPNGLSEVSRLLEEIHVTSDVMEFDDRPGLDVGGPYPIVPLYCAHEPAHFMAPGVARVPTPIIEFVVQVGANASIGATQMMNFGAALIAFVDRLEAAGRRVGVTSVMLFEGGGRQMRVQTRVKRPEDPVSLDAMAFSLAHPAVFRRLGFALLESCRAPAWVSTFRMGYGRTERFRKAYLQDLDEAVVLVGGVGDGGDWRSPRQAISSMRTRLSKAAPGELSDLLSSSH